MTGHEHTNIQLRLERHAPVGLVEQVASGIERLIENGNLRFGMRLPSVRQFALEHDVSNSTVVDAYERLVAKGLVVARRGAGFFIDKRESSPSPARGFMLPSPVIDSDWLLSEVFADDRVPIKSGCGWLPGKWLAGEGLRQAERQLVRAPDSQQVGYGHPYGYAPLRETIAKSLDRWSLDVAADQVITTHGATQALDIILRTMVKPGDTVLIEDPGYCNLIAMLKLAHVNIVGVPRIPGGIDIDALDELARQHKPTVFFTNPTLQNPTGTSYTPACAMRLLQLAERHGFWVVEDDLYREIASPTDPMLAALDGLQRVIYVSGFSKTIAPSLRLGYLVCDPALARKFAHTKMLLTLTSSEVTERLVHLVLTEGHHRRHVERLSASLLEAQARLNGQLESASLIPFAAPRGGMFTWAALDRPGLGLSAREIADRALLKGIWLAPGEFFFLSTPDRPWFRFNAAYSDVPELIEFFQAL
jgi:DNA-binding transcriptional MocR family regulator